MLKEFLSTAAVLAIVAGPAYAQTAQPDQGASGSADAPAAASTSTSTDTSTTAGGSETSVGAASSGSGAAATTDTTTSGAAGTSTTGAAGTAATGTPSDSPTAPSADASSATMSTGTGETFLTDQAESQWRAEKLIGANVKNAQDENIGKINDLVFNEDGRIQAGVVSVGGFLGIGAKNVALSWDQFQVRSSDAGDEVLVSLTKEQLEEAPAFRTLETKRSEEAAESARMQQGTTPPAGTGTR